MPSAKKHETYNPYHQTNPDQILSLRGGGDELDKQKKPIVRRTVDYHATIINYLETRAYFRTFREFKKIHSTTNAIRHMRPIPLEKGNESQGFCTKYVSTSINKHKCAINCLVVECLSNFCIQNDKMMKHKNPCAVPKGL